MDPAEIRRRNFIGPEGFPFHSPVGVVYDSGEFAEILDMALGLADRQGFAARRQQSASQGRLRGQGLACWIESSGAAPSAAVTALGCRAGLYQAAKVRVHPTGGVTVFTGAHSHGHETTFAQVVAEKFGLPVDQVDVVHGDTATVPFGMGTYGSRSMAVGGGALALTADKVIEKGKKIAADLLEASEQDVVFEDATFKVAGTDRQVSGPRWRSRPTCRATIRSTSWSPVSRRPPSTTRRTSPSPTACSSARSRSTRRPATSGSTGWSGCTTPAP
jgi:carbon-monoxide dehydrogenase large subunit